MVSELVQTATSGAVPLWLKISYTLFVCFLVPVYWVQYGPANFLWFSDIALLLTVPALWLESGFLASMMAVSVVLFELAWNVDYFAHIITGKQLIGLSSYMFDQKLSLFVRAISLFHVVLPPLLLWLVYRLGYDTRAFVAQTLLALVVLPISYWTSSPQENINWVYGFGDPPYKLLPMPFHVVMLMLAFPLLIYLPTHLILKKIFG